MLAIVERSVALKPADSGDAHARDQIRILSIGFLAAPPAWIAYYVNHRSQYVMRSAYACFFGGHGE